MSAATEPVSDPGKDQGSGRRALELARGARSQGLLLILVLLIVTF